MSATTTSTNGHTDRRPRPVDGAPSPEAEIGALFGELSAEARLLLQLEVELAKAEIKESTRHAAGAGAGFGAAALVGYLAVALIAVAAALGLAEVMPAGFAFLIVGLLCLGAAAAAMAFGRKNLDELAPVPHRTLATLKENIAWLRARMN